MTGGTVGADVSEIRALGMSGACGTVVATVSWPALCRPSTTGGVGGGKVVVGRAKPGHDTGATASSAPLSQRLCGPPGHDDLGQTSPLAKGRPNLPAACCSRRMLRT